MSEPSYRRLRAADRESIAQRVVDGESCRAIALDIGVSPSSVSRLLKTESVAKRVAELRAKAKRKENEAASKRRRRSQARADELLRLGGQAADRSEGARPETARGQAELPDEEPRPLPEPSRRRTRRQPDYLDFLDRRKFLAPGERFGDLVRMRRGKEQRFVPPPEQGPLHDTLLEEGWTRA